MNYQQHYDNLVNRSRTRELSEYSERHHVVPRCMGGDNKKENIVRLTPEEHYVAHQLLVKIHPSNRKLILAVKMMTVSGGNVVRNNKMFGWLKKKFIEVQKKHARPPSQKGKKQSKEHIEKRISPLRGGTRSAESIQKQSESSIGKPGTRNGAILSDETKQKLSISVSSVEKVSCEHCGIRSSPGNYKRWHGINCRNKHD